MPRISDLSALTAPSNDDELAIVDKASATTKKIKRGDLIKGTPLPNDSVTTAAIQDDAVTADKLAPSAVTYGNLNLGSFPNAVLSNSTSITVPAGTWLVIHTLSLEQASAASASVFIYSVTNMQSTTWTAKASGQTAWNRITNIGIQVGAGTVSRTTSTNTNTNTPVERFIAIPLLQAI